MEVKHWNWKDEAGEVDKQDSWLFTMVESLNFVWQAVGIPKREGGVFQLGTLLAVGVWKADFSEAKETSREAAVIQMNSEN